MKLPPPLWTPRGHCHGGVTSARIRCRRPSRPVTYAVLHLLLSAAENRLSCFPSKRRLQGSRGTGQPRAFHKRDFLSRFPSFSFFLFFFPVFRFFILKKHTHTHFVKETGPVISTRPKSKSHPFCPLSCSENFPKPGSPTLWTDPRLPY